MRKNFTQKIMSRFGKFAALLLFLLPLLGSGQTRTVTGTVTESNGDPVIGATVTVLNTALGVWTNNDGKFTINSAPANGILEVSFIGFEKQQVQLTPGTNDYKIVLATSSLTLEDVVVVGYGTVKKANLTGSVSTVGSDKIANRPVMNVATALAGTAPGVSVTQSSGNPGSEGVAIDRKSVV